MTATTTPGAAPVGAVARPVRRRTPSRPVARPRQRRRRASDAPAQRHGPVEAARRRGRAPAAVYVIAGVICVLTMLGLVMVLSASSVSLLHQGHSPWAYFDKQVMWAVLGTISLVTTMRVPYVAGARG